MKNKKIGILGGVGPQSSNFIYEKIIELAQSKYGAKNNNDYPRLSLESIPVPDFISDKSSIEVAQSMLVETVKSLSASGVTRLCIGSNTVHILLDELQKHTDVPFISMIELVANRCVSRGFKKVGVLGTPVLIHSGLYSKELAKHGITTVFPNDSQLNIVENLIRHVISGTKNEQHKNEYIAVLNDLFNQGAEAIILGCTELPLAVNYEALGDRTLNSDEILAEGIVDYYYSD